MTAQQKYLFRNNAVGRLAFDITDEADTIVLLEGDGAKFPSPSGASEWFEITVILPDLTYEIMRVTSRTLDAMTVLRAQGGTSAKDFPANTIVENRATAQFLMETQDNIKQLDSDLTDLQSRSGDIESSLTYYIEDRDTANEFAADKPDGATLIVGNDEGAAVPGLWSRFTVLGGLAVFVMSLMASMIGFLQAGIGAVVRSVQDKLGESYSFMDFGAKGDGATDDTAAINLAISSIPVGATLKSPTGKVFRVTDVITANKRMTMKGNGEILFDGAAGLQALINVTAPEVKLLGLRLRHSGVDFTCRGIFVRADDVVIDNCDVLNFHSGIQVRFDGGEFFRSTITNNRVLDVRGFGLGPNDSTDNGEADGDGIVTWGAQATISNNIVSCKAGSDARIGIHCEGLAQGNQPVNSGSLCTVSSNIVYGQFRRGIVTEGMNLCTVTANTISDATWWGLAMISCSNTVFSGNAIAHTRQSGDNQGSFYSPTRGPLMIYGRNNDCAAVNNVIKIRPLGVASNGISVQGTSSIGSPTRCLVAHNAVSVENTGSMTRGAQLIFGGDEIDFIENNLSGFSGSGILANNGMRLRVLGNRVIGTASLSTSGIKAENCDYSMIKNNHIENINTGAAGGRAIEVVNRTGHQVIGNFVMDCGVGADGFNTTSSFYLHNIFKTVTTPTANTGGANNVNTPNITIA